MIQLRRVLFPTDFSELSLHALAYARSFAEAFKAELHVLHVVDEAYQYWMAAAPNTMPIGPTPAEIAAGAKAELDKFVKKNLVDVRIPTSATLIVGRPFLEIIRYARDKVIDLIVLGTHGRSGLSHVLLGSVAEKVVRKSPCPVLTIRHPEHEFVMP
jgi:nucleotide-binding universal stress UspA family protein